MQRTAAVVAFVLAACAAARAQSSPGDPGAGTERGVQQVNNSGQVGTVTIYRGAATTRVALDLKGTDGRAQSVRLYRGPSCDDLAARPTYVLADAKNGTSRSILAATTVTLLSGNYNIVVFSNNHAGARTTACGHLYQ